MKRTQPCHVCIDLLTIDKDFIFDEDSQHEFRLLHLIDRGGLKYPSEFILESIVSLWKTLIAIESKDNLTEYCRGEFEKFTTFLTSKKCRNWPVFG